MSDIQVIQQSFSSEFYAIQQTFNPKAKVPYKVIMEAKQAILPEKGENSEKADVEITDAMMKYGKEIQKESNQAKSDFVLKCIGIFYQTSKEVLDNLDYEEVQELWQQILKARPAIADFLGLKTEKNT